MQCNINQFCCSEIPLLALNTNAKIYQYKYHLSWWLVRSSFVHILLTFGSVFHTLGLINHEILTIDTTKRRHSSYLCDNFNHNQPVANFFFRFRTNIPAHFILINRWLERCHFSLTLGLLLGFSCLFLDTKKENNNIVMKLYIR